MSLLADVRAALAEVQADPELNVVRFQHQGTWSDGSACAFSVRDPNRGDQGKGLFRLATDPIPASLRLLRIRPGDPEPELGSTFAYQGGLLVLGLWADASLWTGQRTGVCRLVDERAYPLTATVGQGSSTVGFRLRVEARGTLPGGQSTRNDLGAGVSDSHRLHLPPGVTLDPGDVITTLDGDTYQVVPPVQRDALGDLLGGSWQGQAAASTPTPATDPTPQTPTAPSTSPWWDGVDP